MRLRERANLIQTLHLTRFSVPSLDPPSWQLLVQQAGDPHLPSLHTLTLPVTPPYPFEPLFHISPSVRKLSIFFPPWDVGSLLDGIQGLFNGICARAPNLTNLKLESESYYHRDMDSELFSPWNGLDGHHGMFDVDPHASSTFTNALPVINILQDLELFHMASMNTGIASEALLQVLSTLPRLRDVAFGIDLPQQVLAAVQPGFDHLTSLLLSNVWSTDELRLFNSPHLRHLRIYQSLNPGTGRLDPHSCVRTLAIVGQRFQRIRSLRWTAPLEKIGVIDNNFFDTLFRPLVNLRALETLILDFDRLGRVVLRDADLAALVARVPQLRHLAIKYYPNGRPPLSARTLVSIAQACPALLTLQISGVYVSASSMREVEEYPYIEHGLQSLYLAGLECEMVGYCAMIVDVTFPNLDIAECRRRYGRMRWPCEQWGEVLDRVEKFHQGRDE